ncbi:MAG: L-threonine 3-dehydrogenase [Acidobacteria bacterium]|nr:MAG: L-threonine 3-dehydrogenase [Acidobacteriota bacterium]REJ98202.1 MAG: L-threonine 3-dehydrogenase [Acidobacteriota bacterium]REK16946.1 MAG: L-threonine 3-dehydrogenase [Acidobacteriota bacterium]REK42856.1 MAG: L-threonine 3-dehydrogenase [Acidobacteriota bacterium]
MKAIVKSKAEPGLWLEDVPEPQIEINDVKIRVLRTGICGTDVHIYNWDQWSQDTISVPTILGHEIVGEIVEVGSNVADFYKGDIVSVEGHLVCGRCRNCLAGRRYKCANTLGFGVNTDGGFAEFMVVPYTNIWKHDRDIDLDVAAIFDPFGNAVHTALAFEVFGEDVLITGAGPIGIMASAVAKKAGARHIVITDINPKRLSLAEKMGSVTKAINTKEVSVADTQKELGMVEGFDVGFEMSGSPVALKDMIANMAHGGNIAFLGIPSEPFEIDWKPVIFNMLDIKGIYGRQMYETWYQMSVLVATGLDISPVITHRFSYKDFEEGFEAMKTGDSGKVILDWEI